MNRKILAAFFLIAAALLTRLPELAQRPLHVDEAVNAYILGELLESGTYIYNPGEYHGPTLYYFSQIFTFFADVNSFAGLNEFLIRMIPVLAGFGIIILVYLLGNMVRKKAGLPAAFIVTFSPMMTYFNRYYIHESLLVLLSLLLLYLIFKMAGNRSYLNALLIGLTLGLLIATKETWILFAVAMAGAFVLSKKGLNFITRSGWIYPAIIFLAAGFVIILLFTSFFSNPAGLSSFGESFVRYFNRGTATPEHTYPWYYYLNILFYYQNGSRLFMSEIVPLVMAGIGIFAAFRARQGIDRVIVLYAMILLLVFSLIPYKTPWNILGLVPVLAILGGSGFIYLSEKVKTGKRKSLLLAIFMVFLIAEGYELYRINYLYAADMENPFTYGHAREDVRKIGLELEEIFPEKQDLNREKIAVIARDGAYWPLPWYLRRFNAVGWWDSVPQDIAASQVILVTPEMEADLVRQLYELTPFADRQLYLPLFDREMEIRPGVMIRGYIRYDLWQIVNTDSTGN